MIIWVISGVILSIGSAIYLVSYGLWAARQKNWLGAVGIWVVALLTLIAPLGTFLIVSWYR